MIHAGQDATITCQVGLAGADAFPTHGVYYKRPGDRYATLLVGSSSGTDYVVEILAGVNTVSHSGTWRLQFYAVNSDGDVFRSKRGVLTVHESLVPAPA
jgi:hypothetical protein